MVAQASAPLDFDKRIIGIGGFSLVSLYDETTVLKGHVVVLDNRVASYLEDDGSSERSLTLEFQVYKRLGQHKNVIQCLG